MERAGLSKGIVLRISSEIPIAAGMGSSAATAVAAVAAASRLLGIRVTKDDISKAAYVAETIVHGKPSGIDNTVSTYGGVIAFRKNEGFIRLKGDFKTAFLILADSGIHRSTGSMVKKVLELKKKYPSIMEPLYHAAGRLAIEAGKAIEMEDLEKLGELMNINHGLLSAIGVSNQKLEELIYRARSAGALGSKITGAGGGGFIIALCTGERVEEVKNALKDVSKRIIVTRIENEGVRAEDLD